MKRSFTKAQAKPAVDTYAFAARDVTAPAKAGIRILPSALPPHGDTGAGLLAVTAQQHSTPKP